MITTSKQTVQSKRAEYNDIPVCYCTRCLGLHIIRYNADGIDEYCLDCGSTDTEEVHIEKWQELVKENK